MTVRVAVDIGGTFTDVVGFDEEHGSIVIGKTLSTPNDLIEGIFTGLEAADVDPAATTALVHGSTVVINSLIERKGARAAIITTEGFRDVYEIGRVNRPDAFNLGFTKHRALVPRDDVFEIAERVRADGRVQTPLDQVAARRLARTLAERGIEAAGVVLLHSYRNPEHEVLLGAILREENPGMYVSLSHELTREYREFERTSTTAANAFVGPKVSVYLSRLESELAATGSPAEVSIMQSNGGLSDLAQIRQQSVQMMESGPAGGVVGTIELCKQMGYDDAIAFDMGGTTAKAAVIRSQTFPQAAEYFVGGYRTGLPIRIPCLDIVEVGTGGGSVAWVDSADGLHVGPISAGADPGPACYGRGGVEATVTDAAVVLGLLDSGRALSGELQLDSAAAHSVVSTVADRIGVDTVRTASGILAIAAATMANAVRAVTTERGLDPRDFSLFAYGGNGPLHISLVARELGVSRVVIPPVPAVFSALGMLMADVRHDLVLTEITSLNRTTSEALDSRFVSLEADGRGKLASSGVDDEQMSFIRYADMRYVGQEHSLTVEVPDLFGAYGIGDLKSVFDLAHLDRFGHSAPDENAEIVTLRLSAVGNVARPSWAEIAQAGDDDLVPAPTGERMVVLDPDEGPVPCVVYHRAALLAGQTVTGPAAIEEGTTTTLLRTDDRVVVDTLGNLIMQIGGSAA
ncbi:hydantoinase/oxoprolinase family protein [Subtercola lobariae]|uniref:5-oxoprolinase n=1 Tax=Subtercola lobariae TaxID=1588641 RepID=A0A917B8N9_9MICO|nr:hydantoinase/oxoprolinase family protein [Subtercola lobariae]GGF30650.1 5-oxoprolinase [Subtercola lobariae]